MRDLVIICALSALLGCSGGTGNGAGAGAATAASTAAPLPTSPSAAGGGATLTASPPPSASVTSAAVTSKAVFVAFDVTAPCGPVFAAVSVPVNGKPAWAPDGVPLKKGTNGHWTGKFPATNGVEWKATRGDWSKVEKDTGLGEIANRTASAGATTKATVARWADETSEIRDLGDFTPSKLGTPRKVMVRLPVGYALRTDERYPVLLVLDGQNVFDPSRSFMGVSWRLDLAGDAHDLAGRESFIAVAIDNTAQRIDEYTPSADPQYGGGRLEDFATFLTDELLPQIAAKFRTKTGPDDTGLMGSSLGGLAAFHVGWKHSDKVRRIGAVSPSMWWNNEETKGMVAATSSPPPLRLWIDVGTDEGSDPQATLDEVRAVAQLCPFAHYSEYPGASHDEASWGARLPDILAWLFP